MASAKILSIAILLSFSAFTHAQSYSIYENQQYRPFEKAIYQPGAGIHTSIQNYTLNNLNRAVNVDSALYAGMKIPQGHLGFVKRLFFGHALQWETIDYTIHVNPLFNLEPGKEQTEGKSTFVNTRGLYIEGTIGKNLAFYTDFVENQGAFPKYIDDFFIEREVIPGQGKAKRLNHQASSQTLDYSQATGYVSVDAGQHFNFQLGHGKNFIGDGYRSMLLSDVAYSYPYFKMTTRLGNVKYMMMWSSLTHLEREGSGDTRYPSKYGVFHYLDWNIGKRFSVGLFESVIWADQDSLGNKRGFDWHYANPFVFFRPVEYSVGSPDNVSLGLNAKFIAAKWLTLYGQLMLDEFKADEMFSGNQWWANKQGFQLGFKTFDLLGIRNLRWQAEFNLARPYLYSYYEPITNYGHYNQELAHPMGGNFKEANTIINYRINRWNLRMQAVKALYGKDVDENSYGHNIFVGSNDRPYDYGHFIGQGLKTDLLIADMSLSFMVNPRNNFNIAIGYRYRNESNDVETLNTKFIYAGIRTSLKNLYYDF
jgi:hypothetical protein